MDGVGVAVRQLQLEKNQNLELRTSHHRESPPTVELGDVFKPAGVPTFTFVEPDSFAEFRLALRQPGLGVILEGPSGVGKTTMIRQAVLRDKDRLGAVQLLNARRPADTARISRLADGHDGLVVIDDFHRLAPDLQEYVANYMKLLADDDASAKVVLVGIPETAQDLVSVSPDLATRIKIFRPKPVTEFMIAHMIEKGERALNITFDAKASIALSAAGSLLTAQTLCWHLAAIAGIERTMSEHVVVHADIAPARAKVAEALRLKFGKAVLGFASLDRPEESVCIDLLLQLANEADGVLRLDDLSSEHSRREAIQRVFLEAQAEGLGGATSDIRQHLHYDCRGRRLIADDPQLIFFLRQLTKEQLMSDVGKRRHLLRDRVFVCYSHADSRWLNRLLVHLKPLEQADLIDVWSDRRIELGSLWQDEIAHALSHAKIGILLVSADMLASDFIRTEELPKLLVAAEEGGCRIIPVLVGPSVFADTPSLSRFQGVKSPRTTLSEMSRDRAERALAELAQSLLRMMDAQLR